MTKMRHFQTITVLPASALDGMPAPKLEVRQRRFGSLIACALSILLAVALLPLALLWHRYGAPLWLAMFPAGSAAFVSALYGWHCLRHAKRASGPDGWVLREDGAHLLVNLRSHLNAHFDPATPSVLVLPHRRVLKLSVVRERGLRTHAGDQRVIFENLIRRVFLDIVFDGDRETVAGAVAAEATRRGKTPFGSSRYNHSAVCMLPGNVLRIAWRDESNRLAPDIAEVRRALVARYRFSSEDAPDQTAIKTLERAEQEARLLEMVARGERLQAIALAKILYNMQTREAVEFVDGLR